MAEVEIKSKKGYSLEISGKGEVSTNSKSDASNGTYVVNAFTEVTKNIVGIFVLEDTVFTSIKVDGVDVKNSYILATETAVKSGAYITPLNGKVFSGLQISSGSVILNLA
jgi:hypothetical protein